MAKGRKADWVVLNYDVQPTRFECRRCGETYTPAFPCSLDMFGTMTKTFLKEHRSCSEPKEKK